MGGVVRKLGRGNYGGSRRSWAMDGEKDADGSPFGGTLVDGPRGGMREDKSERDSWAVG